MSGQYEGRQKVDLWMSTLVKMFVWGASTMEKILIDKNGQIAGTGYDVIESGSRLIEMSATQTLCLLSEKCDRGYVTRVIMKDGSVRLVRNSARSLITMMTAQNFWPTQWELSSYYALYETKNNRLNKAEIAPGAAFYPVTDSQRNTSWINASVITGVTGTARGTVIETSVGFNFHVTKNVDRVRADLVAIRVISHWMCQAYNANRLVNECSILAWTNWPLHVPFDVDVVKLEQRKVISILGHLGMHVVVKTKHRRALAEIAEHLQERSRDKYRRVKCDWINDILGK